MCNSFAADTPVQTPDGDTPISAIKEGDLVLAYNEALGTTGTYTVTDVLIHNDPLIETLTLNGEQIETTPEHPFYVLMRGWVDAGKLRLGDSVRKQDSSYGTVDQKAIERRTQPMYNLTVDTAHTFFVGEAGWLVHNVDCAGNTKVYHGTDAASAADIEANGLNANKWQNAGGSQVYDQKGFSVTTDPEIAQQWAEWRAMERGGKPVVLEADRATLQNVLHDTHPQYSIDPFELFIAPRDFSKVRGGVFRQTNAE